LPRISTVAPASAPSKGNEAISLARLRAPSRL
jgi:hypothetical protein